MATIAEGLAIASEIAKEVPDRDIYQVSISNDEVRVHLCWTAFQRMFGGQEVEIRNGCVTAEHNGVTYSAMMRRVPAHGTIVCPKLGIR